MKKYLLLAALLLPVMLHAQSWKEYYVTAAKDTIRPGQKVKLKDVKTFQFVSPSKNFPTNNPNLRQPISDARYARYKDHLNMYMKDKVYEIYRLTRIKGDEDDYIEFATILIEDSRITHTNPVEYVIAIERALKYDEVAFLK